MLMHILLYLIPAYQQLKIEIEKSSRFKWLLQMVIGFIAVILFSLFVYGLMEFGWIEVSTASILSSLMVAVLIYAIGFLGFRDAKQNLEKASKPQTEKRGYFSQKEAKNHLQALEQKMASERLYLDPGLNLNSLSKAISIQPYQLSQLLNDEKGQSFPDFVNHYRIEEVKRKILDPSQNNLTILAMAMDSGFNTKSAFNQAFKKFTGMTPSQYRKGVQEG